MPIYPNCNPNLPVTMPLEDQERDEFIARLDLPDNSFGLGLVMGGTVSAGAWTAGVLDFLTEALDAWQAAKDAKQDVPTHKVQLAIMTGSSGGGVCGAQLTRALPFQFPHMHRDPNSPAGRNDPKPIPADAGTNPLWQTWIDDLRFQSLITTVDFDKDPALYSLLDGNGIDVAAENIVNYKNEYTNVPRPWVHQKCQMVFALTNLCGMPYSIDFATGRQNFMDRADNARFRVSPMIKNAALPVGPEIAVMYATAPTAIWTHFASFAKSTGAFPIGFPARPLSRCITDYRYRVIESQNNVVGQIVDGVILADGQIPPVGSYDFLTVDAGCIDNAPVEIARTYLSGVGGRNDRNADTADRAVILIDPFADIPTFGPRKSVPIFEVIQNLITGLVAQNRYNTRDLALAAHADVYSRFMLTARRMLRCDDKEVQAVGGTALCSARFSAFFGFFDKEYSKHDYFLGRQNCREFLTRELAMPFEQNPLGYTKAQAKTFGHEDIANAA